jgi:Leu/Phe-tRNA-protein transferase
MPSDSTQTDVGDGHSTVETYPRFHLTFAYDRSVEPREITIFPAEEDENHTRWISADHRATIPLEQIRQLPPRMSLRIARERALAGNGRLDNLIQPLSN